MISSITVEQLNAMKKKDRYAYKIQHLLAEGEWPRDDYYISAIKRGVKLQLGDSKGDREQADKNLTYGIKGLFLSVLSFAGIVVAFILVRGNLTVTIGTLSVLFVGVILVKFETVSNYKKYCQGEDIAKQLKFARTVTAIGYILLLLIGVMIYLNLAFGIGFK